MTLKRKTISKMKTTNTKTILEIDKPKNKVNHGYEDKLSNEDNLKMKMTQVTKTKTGLNLRKTSLFS